MATIERIGGPTWRLELNEREAQLIGSLLGWIRTPPKIVGKLHGVFSGAGTDMSSSPYVGGVDHEVELKSSW